MVVATALLGMVTMILTTLNERRREKAILCRPRTILGLRLAEAGAVTSNVATNRARSPSEKPMQHASSV